MVFCFLAVEMCRAHALPSDMPTLENIGFASEEQGVVSHVIEGDMYNDAGNLVSMGAMFSMGPTMPVLAALNSNSNPKPNPTSNSNSNSNSTSNSTLDADMNSNANNVNSNSNSDADMNSNTNLNMNPRKSTSSNTNLNSGIDLETLRSSNSKVSRSSNAGSNTTLETGRLPPGTSRIPEQPFMQPSPGPSPLPSPATSPIPSRHPSPRPHSDSEDQANSAADAADTMAWIDGGETVPAETLNQAKDAVEHRIRAGGLEGAKAVALTNEALKMLKKRKDPGEDAIPNAKGRKKVHRKITAGVQDYPDGETRPQDAPNSHGSPSLGACPSMSDLKILMDSLKWAIDALMIFKCEDMPPEFATIVKKWIQFEIQEKFSDFSRFSASDRPGATHDWIAQGRSTTFQLRPPSKGVDPAEDFERKFWRWWANLQPDFCSRNNADDALLALDDAGHPYQNEEGDWDEMCLPGSNGWTSIIAALCFWSWTIGGMKTSGYREKTAAQRARETWVVAVKDIEYVLDHLL
ncbi:hypothetical protein IW262DRAFT_1468807 [Armillaria fumosa]|nr:hypothetical protein IW262DRAFT_1468807 [Armillaria fumosa]